MVDLHLHSSCSDGGLSPADVVTYAAERDLRAIALTDHDTLAGNDQARREGDRIGLPVIEGVEISTRWGGVTFHLLGYGLRRRTRRVSETFAFLEESRRQRNPRMIERLRNEGIEITLEEVREEAGGPVIGRPHFARVLVRKGAVKTVQEAFDRYLTRGAVAYVDKERLTPEESQGLIAEAGGVTVLAHPGVVDEEAPGRLAELLDHLIPLGLAGIEAYYSGHSAQQTSEYLAIARSRSLLVTGGSDFHCPGDGGPEMGRGFGSLKVPDACYKALAERLGNV